MYSRPIPPLMSITACTVHTITMFTNAIDCDELNYTEHHNTMLPM